MTDLSLDLDQLNALAAVVSEGTFDAAARSLHVTPSAVSQRIKALEAAVGRVLVMRSKPVSPTESGETLLRAARQIRAIADDAAATLHGGGAGAGSVIPLAANADSLATWLVPALVSVGADVTFDLRRDDESRTAELLRAGTVMAAVTASGEAVPGCTVHPLGRMRYRARATPDYAARWFPDGTTVEALARAPVVTFDRSDEIQDRYLRRRTRRRLDPPRHYVPGSGAFAQAVHLGLGWGMVPDLQAGPSVVELDPARGTIDVRLFWQQWRLRTAVLDRAAGAVRAHAAGALL
jgi:LysR family transcriptional regulator, chromosome initiation inhibitor